MTNSYVIPLFVAGSILLVVFVFFLIAYLVVHKNKQNAFLIEKNRLIYDQQAKILQARIEEHEKTLNDVSKELHDNVGQLLGFVRMNMRVIGNFAHEKQQSPIQTVNRILDEVMLDVRHISHSLNSEFIKGKGLHNCLAEELEYLKTSKKLACSIDVEGDYQSMSAELELAIFRIAQEAINNTLKHANATLFSIHLKYTSADFTAAFIDDGDGFDGSDIDRQNGIGFINMRERAKLINGTLEVKSTPSEGCIILLSVPKVQVPENVALLN